MRCGLMWVSLAFIVMPQLASAACCSKFSLTGLENTAQAVRMGVYQVLPTKLHDKPIYKHSDSKNHIFFFNHDRWMIGPQVGMDQAGVFVVGQELCPNRGTAVVVPVKWLDSVTFKDGSVTISCLSDESTEQLPQPPQAVTTALTFDRIDKDHSGTISFDELRDAFKQTGKKVSDEELKALFAVADVDENEQIDFDEFSKLMEEYQKKHSESEQSRVSYKQFTEAIDSNKDAEVSEGEVAHAFGITISEAANLLKSPGLDSDGNGKVTPIELARWIDTDNSGFISVTELATALKNCADCARKAEKFIQTILSKQSAATASLSDVKDSVAVSDVIKHFDQNGDNVISTDEIASVLSLSPKEAKQIASKIDKDNDGTVTGEELRAALDPDGDGLVTVSEIAKLLFDGKTSPAADFVRTVKAKPKPQTATASLSNSKDSVAVSDVISSVPKTVSVSVPVSAVINLIDRDGDGVISANEFATALGLPPTDAQRIAKTIDKDHDGSVTQSELRKALDPDGDGQVTIPEIAKVLFGDAKLTERAADFVRSVQSNTPVQAKSTSVAEEAIPFSLISRHLKQRQEMKRNDFVLWLGLSDTPPPFLQSQNPNEAITATQLANVLKVSPAGLVTVASIRKELFAGNTEKANLWLQSLKAHLLNSDSHSIALIDILAFLDTNNDKQLTTEEIADGLRMSPVEAKKVIDRLGTGEGKIDVPALVYVLHPEADGTVTAHHVATVLFGEKSTNRAEQWISHVKAQIANGVARQKSIQNDAPLFSRIPLADLVQFFDTDGTGQITTAEFAKTLQLSQEQTEAIMNHLHKDHHGLVSIDDLTATLDPTNTGVVSSSVIADQLFVDGNIRKAELWLQAVKTSVEKAKGQEWVPLSAVAKRFDIDGDGTVDAAELAKSSGLTLSKAKEVVKAMDQNGDGELTVNELSKSLDQTSSNKATLEAVSTKIFQGDTAAASKFLDSVGQRQQVLRAKAPLTKTMTFGHIVRFLDPNNDGEITFDELLQRFGLQQDEAKQLMAKIDLNGDGSISLSELRAFLEPDEQDKVTLQKIADKVFHGEASAIDKWLLHLRELSTKVQPVVRQKPEETHPQARKGNVEQPHEREEKFSPDQVVDEDELFSVRAIERFLDPDGDGTMTVQELQSKLHVSAKTASQLIIQLRGDATEGINVHSLHEAMEPDDQGLVDVYHIATVLFGGDKRRAKHWLWVHKQTFAKLNSDTVSSVSSGDLRRFLDVNMDGAITREELMQRLGISSFAADRVIQSLDKNSDGSLSVDELMKSLDPDNDSVVSLNDIAKKLLQADTPRVRAKQLIEHIKQKSATSN